MEKTETKKPGKKTKKPIIKENGEVEEIEEEPEQDDELIQKREKPRKRHHPKTKKKPSNEENEQIEQKDLEPINSEEENEYTDSRNINESKEESDKYDIVEGTTNMGKYFNKHKKNERKTSEDEEIKEKPITEGKKKRKPITRIGEKTDIGKLLEKYNFLRTHVFSLKNLKDPNKKFDKKSALLLDLLNEKEQKTKILLWKAFCIWRGNVIDKY